MQKKGPDTSAIISEEAVIRRWQQHPVKMVLEVFGPGYKAQYGRNLTLESYQEEFLEALPRHQRLCMKAAKGPGKTCTLAWAGWWFLLVKPDPKVIATSITGDNLRDGLWAEMSKWQQLSPLLLSLFQWTQTRIFLKAQPETWFMVARSWAKTASAEEQANTLAGYHADYIMFILDESGAIPMPVMVAADPALSSCVEGHILQAGNPEKRSGPLYAAVSSQRGLWYVVEITGDPDDPKRASRISEKWAREQIEMHGADNPWVLVNVFGRFPPHSLDTLLGPDDISAAEKRSWHEHDIEGAARTLGIDIARFGDAESVMFPRQGLVAFTPTAWRNIDSLQGAGAVGRKIRDWQADATFVDNTGGFGAGWIDRLEQLGHSVIPVAFNGIANDRRYFNKRSEMYFLCAEWIKGGGQLPPDCPQLGKALTQITYSYKGDRLIMEDKVQLTDRIGFSPDHTDALVLTFAQPIAAHMGLHPRSRGRLFRADYDPFEYRPDELPRQRGVF